MRSRLLQMPTSAATRPGNAARMGERSATAPEGRQAERAAALGLPGEEEAVLRRWEPMARRLAHRYAGAAETEDLEQVARIALLRAARRFDPARGCPFPAFAVPTILGEIRHYLRDQQRTIRIPTVLWDMYLPLKRLRERLAPALGREPTAAELARGLSVGEEDVVGLLGTNEFTRLKRLDEAWTTAGVEEVEPWADRLGGLDPQLEAVEQQIALQQLLRGLPERLREILQRRYFRGHTQAEIAQWLGVSQMQVSRLERRALAQLREEMRGPARRLEEGREIL